MESLLFVGCTILAAAGALAVGVKVITNSRKLSNLRKQQGTPDVAPGSEDFEKEIDKIVNKTK